MSCSGARLREQAISRWGKFVNQSLWRSSQSSWASQLTRPPPVEYADVFIIIHSFYTILWNLGNMGICSGCRANTQTENQTG
jgi:hypothetical protein